MDAKTENHHYVIIGAGAAGLQFAYFCGRSKRDYLVLERKPFAGGQFSKFPRHRGLISINKVFTGENDYERNMRFDWNSLLLEEGDREKQPPFKAYCQDYFPNADWLVKYMCDFVENLKINVHFNTDVERISKKADGTFKIQAANGNAYSCKALVNCSGYQRPFIPPTPGIEDIEHYPSMSIEESHFENQRVLVIGKGNSGFETADKLIPTAALIHIVSPNPINFAWKTHYIGHVRALNMQFLDTYQLKSGNAVLDASIEKIKKNADGTFAVSLNYSHAMGETETLTYDRVLNCTGFMFDSSIFDASCMPDVCFKGKFPAQRPNWESTNIDDLFFVGVLSHCLDFKKTTSGFIHGFRYNARCLFRHLDLRYFGVPFPCVEIPATVDGLSDKAIARANSSSALWQLFGYHRDLITFNPDYKKAIYHEEITEFQIMGSNAAQTEDYYTWSLEFGKITGDPFAIERAPVPDRAQESIFLHPVMRHFKRGNLVGEKHLLEDLYTDWTHPVQHVKPLKDFMTEQFQTHSAPRSGPAYVYQYNSASQMPQMVREKMMITPAKTMSKM